MTKPRDKPTPWRGRVRIAGGSSSAAARGDPRDRGRRDQMIQEEENLERAGRTISPGACLDTPHLEKIDRDYITEYFEEVIMRRPNDTHAHPVLNLQESRRW